MQLTRTVAVTAIPAVVTFFCALPARGATLLPVPFVSQAPGGNWEEPWRDFCEEASVVMAANFVFGLALEPRIAEQEMWIIKRYEELVLGGRWQDTSVEETASVLRVLFGVAHVATRTISSANDIKQELSAGRLVVAPAAGQMLINPHFQQPGPIYHMVVIRGFDDMRGVFIVNDPGTRFGEGFRYDQYLLFNAIHDWNHGDVLNGEKRVMIVGR